MSKTLKRVILLIVIALGFLFLAGVEVKAADITSIEDLTKYLANKDVKIENNTITLNQDLDLNDDFPVFKKGEYTIDLNGKLIESGEFEVEDGTVTIKDSKENGEMTAYIVIKEKGTVNVKNGIFSNGFENSGTLNIDNGTITSIINIGTANIKNGTVEEVIFNEETGILNIDNGTFGALAHMGTLTIKGGTFKSTNHTMLISPNAKKTTLTGGEFIATITEAELKEEAEKYGQEKDEISAITIQKEGEIFASELHNMLSYEYEAIYSNPFKSKEITYENEEGKKYYDGYYGSTVKITKAIENYSDTFKKIAPNGIWEVTSFKPETVESSEFILTAALENIISSWGYTGTAYCMPNNFNPELASVYIHNEKTGHEEEHRVKVIYKAPNPKTTEKVNSVLDNMKDISTKELGPKTGYLLEDLYLINYLNSSKNGFKGIESINFAKDFINDTAGSNISLGLDSRLGDRGALFSYAGGQAIVYFDGKPCTSKNAGVTASNVLYVPTDTENTDKAYIEAATKRIKNYLGAKAEISISVGGTLESLNEYDQYAQRVITFNENGFIDEKTCGSNYYNVTIGNKVYKFAICKKDISKLETPKYIGTDITSKISITSDATTIPLDATISVKEVTNETIKKALGTEKYTAFDISIYSNTKNEKITKLENGEFEVNIPLPEIFKDKKELSVYYIDDKTGKKEEHTATVKNGYVTFETNHFSTYALSEKRVKDDTPPTGNSDIINYVIITTTIAGIGIITLKKKN